MPDKDSNQERLFDLDARVTETSVVDFEGGYRVDFDYQPSSVQTNAGALDLVSGSDRVFLSADGYVEFDSRITLSLQKNCYLGGRFLGRADLRDCRRADGSPRFDPKSSGDAVVSGWKEGLGKDSYLPLLMAVTFDVPTQAIDPSYDGVYDKWRKLGIGRRLLIGTGRIRFGEKKAEGVTLAINKVTP
jgi:hypothetical protein